MLQRVDHNQLGPRLVSAHAQAPQGSGSENPDIISHIAHPFQGPSPLANTTLGQRGSTGASRPFEDAVRLCRGQTGNCFVTDSMLCLTPHG
jgi:hypothetical protein